MMMEVNPKSLYQNNQEKRQEKASSLWKVRDQLYKIDLMILYFKCQYIY